ncbi:MAG: M20/M25/M40 family metallo-hydrolase [Bacteroides sp.]|nr:M20/M25/M40 family metallo-hydrolase [Bacteroides sp.]MCM1413162.1 M20/M25/M40 family metallo-hydrolase [Bacteroides sp.]MCM1472096.1 M20/M25/M40 family metallo-hydrolase [Bacteroides sp.]
MISTELSLLKRMIAIPSFSREETAVADMLFAEIESRGLNPRRFINNIWCLAPGYDPSRPTLMLNSHIDTVRASARWSHDPFDPVVEGDRLYGLGSNDAGASVVSLISLFESFYNNPLPFNLMLAITAEEEVMGEGGMRAFLPILGEEGIRVDMVIVGEPTEMQPAVGERGLVVLDAVTRGVSGHAARSEGVNAIYKAMADIDTLRCFEFPRSSSLLGPISLNITRISAGTQHNVVPDECRWVVDVRTTDAYTNPEIVEILQAQVESQLTPRSTRVWASAIDECHPLVRASVEAGGRPFVSPTTSDMALMHNIPSLKIGPGKSSRSHTADEFVCISELIEANKIYNNIITNLICNFGTKASSLTK